MKLRWRYWKASSERIEQEFVIRSYYVFWTCFLHAFVPMDRLFSLPHLNYPDNLYCISMIARRSWKAHFRTYHHFWIAAIVCRQLNHPLLKTYTKCSRTGHHFFWRSLPCLPPAWPMNTCAVLHIIPKQADVWIDWIIWFILPPQWVTEQQMEQDQYSQNLRYTCNAQRLRSMNAAPSSALLSLMPLDKPEHNDSFLYEAPTLPVVLPQ